MKRSDPHPPRGYQAEVFYNSLWDSILGVVGFWEFGHTGVKRFIFVSRETSPCKGVLSVNILIFSNWVVFGNNLTITGKLFSSKLTWKLEN